MYREKWKHFFHEKSSWKTRSQYRRTENVKFEAWKEIIIERWGNTEGKWNSRINGLRIEKEKKTTLWDVEYNNQTGKQSRRINQFKFFLEKSITNNRGVIEGNWILKWMKGCRVEQLAIKIRIF